MLFISHFIIANINIISTGINLDDEDGGFPRTLIIAPNYQAISTNQLFHRFSRTNTKSITQIITVYSSLQECNIINSVNEKSEILESIKN